MISLKTISGNKLYPITIIAFVFKTLQFFLITPQIVPDSNDYITVSQRLFDVSSDTFGLRTPVYPIFIKILSVFSSNLNFIIAVQLLLGILSVILVYVIAKDIGSKIWDANGKEKAATIASLLLLFSPTALYDSVISTESLAIFLNILFLFTIIKAVQSKKSLYLVLCGIILTLLVMTRPQYLIFIPALAVYFIIQKSRLKTYFIIIIPFIISVAWMYGVYTSSGMFNMTTLAGYNLINHTGKYIEKAPAEYEALKSIYIRQRDENLNLRGNQSGTIWQVRDTLQKTLKLNKTELSLLLNKINKYLILNYPFEYLKSVYASLRIALIVPDDDFRIIHNSLIFRFLVPAYQLIIGAGFAAGLFGIFLFSKSKIYSFHLLTVFLVTANLIASCIFDFGINGRFFTPSYFILFICCANLFIYIMDYNKKTVSYTESAK